MNHAEAQSAGAAERYLLGQLSPTETEEFEQHFFDCQECTRELQLGALFEENAKAVFAGERAAAGRVPAEIDRPVAAKPSILAWFWQRPWGVAAPALASVLLLGITAYQGLVVVPGLRSQLHDVLAPQAVASNVLPPISRGDARPLVVPEGGRFYTIYMDPTWEGSFTAYLCSVLDESGAVKFSVRLPAPPPGKPVEILMSRSTLPSGRYTVVIHSAAEEGKPEGELARYALILKLD